MSDAKASANHQAEDNQIEVDLSQAETFLSVLDPNTKTFSFQTFADNRNRKHFGLVESLNGSLANYALKLKSLNDRGAAIAVGVNGTLTARKNELVNRYRAVWCDYDQNKLASKRSLELLLKGFPLEPSIVVRTSLDNYHFYWLARGMGRMPFEMIMARLVEDYGADPAATDPARALRIPGFVHRKSSPHLVQMLSHTGTVYERDQLIKAFPPLARWQLVPPEQDGEIVFCREELDRVQSALSYVEAESRHFWFTFGGAIFDFTSGSDQGFDLWDSWSKNCPEKYDAKEQVRCWEKEFRTSRGRRSTIGSIYHYARENGWPGHSTHRML